MVPAIAKILQGTNCLGTAFAISQEYAITAFHCIGNRQTGAITLYEQALQFPKCEPLPSEYVKDSGSPDEDFALLRLKAPLPKNLQPFPLVLQAFDGAPFHAKGYPASVHGPDWVTVSGTIEDPCASLFGVPALQLQCIQAGHGLALAGLSGAPVLLRKPGAVVGIIRWNPTDAGDPSQPLPGGIVFASQVSSLLSRCPFLKPTILPSPSEAEQLEDLQELRDDAKDEALQERVNKALTQVNRKIVLGGAAAAFQPDWIPVPTFSFEQPKSSEGAVRDLVKAFMNAIALGIHALFPKNAAEIQFVFLLKLKVDSQKVRLDFVIPFQELVGSVKDLIDDPKGSYEQATASGKKPVEIGHKYAIAAGAYFPIVAVYRPVLRHVEFLNKNQIGSPEQFLSPHLCHTTSGFLNFLGVLSVVHLEKYGAESSETPIFHFDNLHHAMNKGLDAWFRWLYCLIDTATFFDPQRLYVSAKNPETYDYRYYTKQGNAESLEKWVSEQ